MKTFIFLVLSLAASAVSAQLLEQHLIVPPQFRSFLDTTKTVMLPAEYEVSVYYAGVLKRPRFMALGPRNTIYVADMGSSTGAGRIFALRDTNSDGIPDTLEVASPPVDSAHSLAFYRGAMYVAEPSRVRKFVDEFGGYYGTEQPFITGIGATGVYNHYTRTILMDTIGGAIYLSVGASCNACRESDPERASILRFNLDGTGRSIYATGLRNALGLAINPDGGQLWAANADRDGMGDDVPQEVITSIRPGGFYGWPFAYGNKQWDDFQAGPTYQAMLPILAADSAKVAGMEIADVQVSPHSTPMAMLFYRDPRTYIVAPPPTAFVAIHGSSPAGRKIGLGYKVIKITYDKNTKTWSDSDFLTGFLTDSINYKFWGRPCGLVQDSAGDIYLSSDVGIPAIYRISLKNSDAVNSTPPSTIVPLAVFPNPATSTATLRYSLPVAQFVRVELIDELGRSLRVIQSGIIPAGKTETPIALGDLPSGVYTVRMLSEAGAGVSRFVVAR